MQVLQQARRAARAPGALTGPSCWTARRPPPMVARRPCEALAELGEQFERVRLAVVGQVVRDLHTAGPARRFSRTRPEAHVGR